MKVERLEQIAALIVTAGLAAGSLALFSPWRQGHEPHERLRTRAPLQRAWHPADGVDPTRTPH